MQIISHRSLSIFRGEFQFIEAKPMLKQFVNYRLIIADWFSRFLAFLMMRRVKLLSGLEIKC